MPRTPQHPLTGKWLRRAIIGVLALLGVVLVVGFVLWLRGDFTVSFIPAH